MIIKEDFMKIYRESIEVQSEGLHPTFHNVTDQVKQILANSGVKNGICVVYSHHTTCSIMIQECSHDKTYFGLEYLQQDLCNLMEKLLPTCRVENQYMHPGPKHIEFADSVGEVGPWTSLNTEAHLRSCILGRSESIVIEDGKLDLGEFGYTYFIDWDQVRARKRTVQVQILGE
jgi:secondary thiamine-phosphate synthase enzyme